MLRLALLATAACLALSGCGSPPQPAPTPTPTASAPLLGGFTSVATDDPQVQAAIGSATDLMRGDAWLAAPDLAVQQVLSAERQVVAGTVIRATLRVTLRGKSRLVRPALYTDLAGNQTLRELDLDPAGSEAPFLEPPTSNNLPGGYTDRQPNEADVQQAAAAARTQLAGPDWLGRDVTITGVRTARSQVVAGTNYYLELQATVAGQPRTIALVLYQDLQGGSSVSWLRLS